MSGRRLTAKVAAFTLLGSLLLTGCAQPEAQPVPAEPSATSWAVPTTPPADPSPTAAPEAGPQGLPYLGYDTVVMTPLIDNAAQPTDETVRPAAQGTVVFDTVDGKALGILSSANVVPVIQRSPGWIRVMLPSRRMLPSVARAGERTLSRYTPEQFVNRGTGWIREADAVIEKGAPRIYVSKETGQLDVFSADWQLLARYPANIGADVPVGPTYIAPGGGVAACGKAKPIMLSAQSETKATYRGQSISPIFIDGPSPECTHSAQDLADMTPRMIQLSPENAVSLAVFLKPGAYVQIVGATQAAGVAA